MQSEVSILGGGLVGSLLATMLAKRGYGVRVFERREDPRAGGKAQGRSINLAISHRGIRALASIGVDEEVLSHAIAMPGRMIHSPTGATTFQPYGKDRSLAIHSLSRGTLNEILINHAEKAGVRFYFQTTLQGLENGTQHPYFEDEITEDAVVTRSPFIFGTDGSGSVLRNELGKILGFKASEETLDYGYKELTLPAGPSQAFLLEKNALHIWPRKNFMLIALPNLDGSFTCTLFFPHRGPLSFETLKDKSSVRSFFETHFSDVVPLFPKLEDQFFENPTGHMITVRTPQWTDGKRFLLLGDAAHAIVPFFGQGMNSGFEDCQVFNELLEGADAQELGPVFRKFEEMRITNTNAIADLALENFIEMRDLVSDPAFLLKKSIEKKLETHFPDQFVSRYSMVSFSSVPYSTAKAIGLKHEPILARLAQGITSIDQLDLKLAASLIQTLPNVKELGYEP